MDTQDELKFVEYIKSKGLLIFLKEDGKRLKEIDKLPEFKIHGVMEFGSTKKTLG